jgi:nitronate monooxygenase
LDSGKTYRLRDNRAMGTELRTPLCRLLGIEYPILSAGFGQGAGPELVAAVSNAGGFGVLGASGVPADRVQRLVARTRELTSRPFGLNIIIDFESDEDGAFVHEQVRAALTERIASFVFFWGDAAPFIEEAHSGGAKVLVQVGSVEEARAAVASGVDAVIAQGVQAGGHVRGIMSIWELLPAAVKAIAPTPVLASGGIGDGAGIARALQLGAQGVSLGTRFVASNEALIHPDYKRRVVESTAADTVYNELYDVWWPHAPHRTLRNKTFDEWDAAGRPQPGQRPGEGTSIGRKTMSSGAVGDWPRYAASVATPDFDGDIGYAPLWAGESCGVVNDIKPAGEIVHDLVRDATAALAT